MRSMGYLLRQTTVGLHIVLSILDCIQKQRRREQISAPAGGCIQRQQALIEIPQFLPSCDCSYATSALYLKSSIFGCLEGLSATAMENAGVIQPGHDA